MLKANRQTKTYTNNKFIRYPGYELTIVNVGFPLNYNF